MNHLNLQYIALFFVVAGTMSCKQASIDSTSEYLKIKVVKSSGDDFSYGEGDKTHYFAPYPFNIGYFNLGDVDQEVLIISKRIDKGRGVQVIPMGKLTLTNENGSEQYIYVSVPYDDDLRITEGNTFSEFTVDNFSFKQIIEYWYSNRYGLQGTSVKGWSPATLDDFR